MINSESLQDSLRAFNYSLELVSFHNEVEKESLITNGAIKIVNHIYLVNIQLITSVLLFF